MKRQLLKLSMLVIAFIMVTAGAAIAAHPELTEQEKLTPCSQCHKEVTPEIYKDWYNSVHGLDNVKCFQCHGTYENLKASPDETNCAACHNAQYMKRPKGKKCWDCHPAHHFFIHK